MARVANANAGANASANANAGGDGGRAATTSDGVDAFIMSAGTGGIYTRQYLLAIGCDTALMGEYLIRTEFYLRC